MGLTVDAEHGEKVDNNFSSPSQADKRDDCGNGTANDKRSSLAPFGSASVAPDADVWLDKSARQRTGYPDKGEERFADAQAKQIWLDWLARQTMAFLHDGEGDAARTEPWDSSTDQAICRLINVSRRRGRCMRRKNKVAKRANLPSNSDCEEEKIPAALCRVYLSIIPLVRRQRRWHIGKGRGGFDIFAGSG